MVFYRCLMVLGSFFIFLAAGCSQWQSQGGDRAPVAAKCSTGKGKGANHLVGPLTVLTLNIAHGRKDGRNQLLLSGNTIRSNLLDVADVLVGSSSHIVALQEADGVSRWSGGFNHVEALAEHAGYSSYCRASHAKSWLFDYGTAILAGADLQNSLSYTFDPSPPTMNKGFLLSEIHWQPDAKHAEVVVVDIISVHLDFSRKSVREQQVRDMARTLADRHNPVIIMGDFNSEWLDSESVIELLAEQTGLHAYRPRDKNLGTYHSKGTRLDWILISRELQFEAYEVLSDIVSDHLAVKATITPSELNSSPCCQKNKQEY